MFDVFRSEGKGWSVYADECDERFGCVLFANTWRIATIWNNNACYGGNDPQLGNGRPLPDQGRGIRRLYITFDIVIVALTVVLMISLLRIPRRFRALRRGIPNRSAFSIRAVFTVALHLVWPLLFLYLVLTVIDWRVILFLYEPDLGYWLSIVALVVFLKGLVELTFLWCAFRQTNIF